MMFDFLKRDSRKLRFRDFVKRLNKQSGLEYANNFTAQVMDVLMRDNTLTYDRIMDMRFEEIEFRVKRVQRQVEAETKMIDGMIEALKNQGGSSSNNIESWLNDPGWQYSIGDEDNR